jgi:hypothetical protein
VETTALRGASSASAREDVSVDVERVWGLSRDMMDLFGSDDSTDKLSETTT